jgi:hypothetical protein
MSSRTLWDARLRLTRQSLRDLVGRDRGRHVNFLELAASHNSVNALLDADALSRGIPLDEPMLRPAAWSIRERRFGPHNLDRYETPANALMPRALSGSVRHALSGAMFDCFRLSGRPRGL